jgi:hypothetical protein
LIQRKRPTAQRTTDRNQAWRHAAYIYNVVGLRRAAYYPLRRAELICRRDADRW